MSESLCIDSPLRGSAMPKAYSGDLRERVIEAVETGASRREAAERFEMSVSSAVKWLQRWRERRSAAPKLRGGSISPGGFRHRVLALIAEQPDLTLVEIVAVMRKRRIPTSRSALWRFLDRHDVTSKKSLRAAEQQRADVARARRRWIREQGMLDPARLVFIDETAVSTNMVRLRGRAPRGERVIGTFRWDMEDDHVRGGFAPRQDDRADGDRGRNDRRDVPRLCRAMLGSNAQAQRHRRDRQLPVHMGPACGKR